MEEETNGRIDKLKDGRRDGQGEEEDKRMTGWQNRQTAKRRMTGWLDERVAEPA